MKLIAIDLELNNPKTNQSIIQIGAVVGDLNLKTIIEEYKANIRLPEGELLQDYISNLTNIKPQEVEGNGLSLKEAVKDLHNLVTKYDCLKSPITWGGGDLPLLRQKYLESLNGEPLNTFNWPFGWRELDVKTVYQTRCLALGLKPQGSLAKSMTKLGLRFQGTKHNALDDAKNTLLLYYKLLEDYKIRLC